MSVTIESVTILASDLVRLEFSASVRRESALQTISNYSFTPMDDSPGSEIIINRIFVPNEDYDYSPQGVLIEIGGKPTESKRYRLTVGNIYGTDGVVISDTEDIIWYRTKLDEILSPLSEGVFTTDPLSTIRMLVTALVYEHNEIGATNLRQLIGPEIE